jgi:hypothetical protein
MAFHGDFSSYPLPELLQWLDSARKTGALSISWEAGERKIFILAGQIVATAAPALHERLAHALHQGGATDGQQVMAALRRVTQQVPGGPVVGLEPESERAVRELATAELIGAVADLTQAQSGRFHFSEDPDRGGDEWVSMELSIRGLLFESLRWIDEAQDVERALPLDSTVVHAKTKGAEVRHTVHRLLLHAARNEINLGKLRLVLGLQRGLVTRGVWELLRARMVEMEGEGVLEEDPIAEMLEKGAVLLRERQFDGAALLFNSLLQSDPADRRVREFARMVEREHVAELYRELPPMMVPVLFASNDALQVLRPEERQVAGLINGRWDVSALVLASQQRELDALRTLHKLARQGLLKSIDEIDEDTLLE